MAVAAIGVGLVSAYMASEASKNAANKAANASKSGIDAQLQMFYEQQAAQKPYQMYGESWLGTPQYGQGNAITYKTSRTPIYGEGEMSGTWQDNHPGQDTRPITGYETKSDYKEGDLVGYDKDGNEVRWSADMADKLKEGDVIAYERGEITGYEGGYDPQANAIKEWNLPGAPTLNAFNASDKTALPGAPNLQTLQYGQEANLPTYQQQLPGNLQDFNFDINKDEVTNYLRDEAAERTNQALAARGLHDSSTAVEQLRKADLDVLANQQDSAYNRQISTYDTNRQNVMALAQEYQTKYGMDSARATEMAQRDTAQYNSQYGKDIDTFNIQNQLSNTQYGREIGENEIGNQTLQNQFNMDSGQSMDQYNINNQLANQGYNQFIDALKIGQGSASAAGAGALQTGQGLASSYNAMGNIYQDQGANQAALYSGMGSIPANAIATNYYMNNMNQPQNNAMWPNYNQNYYNSSSYYNPGV